MSKATLLYALLLLSSVANANEEEATLTQSVEKTLSEACTWLLERVRGDFHVVLNAVRSDDLNAVHHLILTNRGFEQTTSYPRLRESNDFDAYTRGYTIGQIAGKKVGKAQRERKLQEAINEVKSTKSELQNAQAQLQRAQSELKKVKEQDVSRAFWKGVGAATVVVGGLAACTMYAFRNR